MNPGSIAREALLRTLAFHAAWGYPPTAPEAVMQADTGPESRIWTSASSAEPNLESRIRSEEVWSALQSLKDDGTVIERGGRLVLPGNENLFSIHEERSVFQARKLRAARRVAASLARLGGVRFVALCNTTALGHARDEGDLDFFVVARCGSLFQSRGWATLRYKLAGMRPGVHATDRDAVCLSFFVDDSALDLSSLQLANPLLTKERGGGEVERDDPYFRYWFLSLLPLYDDGISSELWDANASILARHPFAHGWIMSPDLEIPQKTLRLPAPSVLDPLAGWLHGFLIAPRLKEMMNRDTRVVVNDHVLKFHADDGRERYRALYYDTCQSYGLAP